MTKLISGNFILNIKDNFKHSVWGAFLLKKIGTDIFFLVFFVAGQKGYKMLNHRRKAKEYLEGADRPTFLETVYKAKVTPVQKEILYLALLDKKSRGYIGDVIGLTEDAVNHEIGKAYDLIFSYISHTVL